jgi:uncharacterized membrane protein YqaE (UPF0057 family)
MGDILLIIFLPFLASGVRARGCGAMVGVFLLWCCFFIPGSIVALVLQLNKPQEALAPVVNVYTQPPPPGQE